MGLKNRMIMQNMMPKGTVTRIQTNYRTRGYCTAAVGYDRWVCAIDDSFERGIPNQSKIFRPPRRVIWSENEREVEREEERRGELQYETAGIGAMKK